ncbi:MAG: HAD family phosphatase [Clostridia bacterium]|nr:HAD family phosphatase [Clostridia bacterium]
MTKQMVIFFDIDGTLLPEGHTEVPEDALSAIRAAQENGHLCLINTGRALGHIEPYLRGLGLDGIVSGCGTMAEVHGEIFWQHPALDLDASRQLIENARACGLTLIYEGYDALAYDLYASPITGKERETYSFAEGRGRKLVLLGEHDSFPVLKFLIDKSRGGDVARFHAMTPGFDFVNFNARWEECTPCGYDKGKALIGVMEHLGLPLEQSIAVGDNTNDLPMLRVCPNSVAMGNGTAKEHPVSFITRRCDDGGIAHMLHHFGLCSDPAELQQQR